MALDVAKAVVDALCSAVGALVDFLLEMLQESWDIPFISDLYTEYISPGNELTALDLFSLMVAIPTTIIYKVVAQEAPFPDDAALRSFRSSYTTQWLLTAASSGDHC